MSNDNNRLKILEKVAAGELTVEDAADLLAAARSAKETAAPVKEKAPKADTIVVEEKPVASSSGKKAKWLKVRVNDLETGQRRVNVNIPIRFMKFGMRIGGKFAPELRDMDIDELSDMMADAESGMLVEVMDDRDGEHVQVYFE